jgi:SAM-dependent methyltransferase
MLGVFGQQEAGHHDSDGQRAAVELERLYGPCLCERTHERSEHSRVCKLCTNQMQGKRYGRKPSPNLIVYAIGLVMKSMAFSPPDGYTWRQLCSILRCPTCGQGLEFRDFDQGLPHAREYGVLDCGCSQYPVVDGVPIFIDGSVGALEHTQGEVEYAGPSRDYLTHLVRKGKGLEALLRCVAFPLKVERIESIRPWRLWRTHLFQELVAALRRRKLRRWCVMDRDALTAQDWFDVFFRQHSPVGADGEMFNYFFYRLTQPRHLAALLLVSALPNQEKPVVDLACGFGHLAYNLAEAHAGQAVVGVDRNFFQLWAAQYWIAPESRFVCADADRPLPFADDSFSATLCSDAFHYFVDKNVAIGEISRCAKNRPILLTRVGNKLLEPNEGFELSPQEYLDVFGGTGWRMFGESDLLKRYLRREPPDFSNPQSPGVMDDEKWIYFVHPGSPSRFTASPDPILWPHSVGRLGVNPIYQTTPGTDGTWRLQFKFPSDHYAFENVLMVSFLPQRVTLPDQTFCDIRANIRSPAVERLIKKMVVIGMPDHYVHN